MFPSCPHCAILPTSTQHLLVRLPNWPALPYPLSYTGFKLLKNLCTSICGEEFQWRTWQSTKLTPGTL